MKESRLRDLWWLIERRPRQPHAYVCQALMTLSMWILRLRGRRAYWGAARASEDGTQWVSPARVYVGHAEIACLFSRKAILRECAFWNSRWGLRLRGGTRRPEDPA